MIICLIKFLLFLIPEYILCGIRVILFENRNIQATEYLCTDRTYDRMNNKVETLESIYERNTEE